MYGGGCHEQDEQVEDLAQILSNSPQKFKKIQGL